MAARVQPPLEEVIQSNVFQMQQARKYHYSHFSTGLHGIYTAVEIPVERDKAVWVDVIHATNSAIQNYLKEGGNSEDAQRWIDAMKVAAPPEDRREVMTLPINGEFATPTSRVDSLKAALFAHGGPPVFPGNPSSQSAAPPPPPRPPAQSFSQNHLTTPPLFRSSSVEEPETSYAAAAASQQFTSPVFPRSESASSLFSKRSLYDQVNTFIENITKALPFYAHPETLRLVPFEQRDAGIEVPRVDAFIELIKFLREELAKKHAYPQIREALKKDAVQVIQLEMQKLEEEVEGFSQQAKFLDPKNLNDTLPLLSKQLKDFAFAVNPPSSQKGELLEVPFIKELETKIHTLNLTLIHQKEVHKGKLTPETLEKFQLQQNFFSGTSGLRKALSDLKTDLPNEFNKVEGISGLLGFKYGEEARKVSKVKELFEHFLQRIVGLETSLKNARNRGELLNIGYNNCLVETYTLRKELASKVKYGKYYSKLDPETQRKVDAQEGLISGSARGRAATVALSEQKS